MKPSLLDDPALSMAWIETPWDSVLFGFPVLHIQRMACRGTGAEAAAAFAGFERQRDAAGCRFASCRLPADRVAESFLLQERGFRVVEMLYHPELDLARARAAVEVPTLEVRRSDPSTLEELTRIAGAAFGNERFHVDPRIPRGLGDRRYRNWVASALEHPRQRLLEVREDGAIVAFFVVEMLDDGSCYWHLNAVAPSAQGRGIGLRAWTTMIDHARREGAARVRSAIVARNVRVMNLYARLGFRFLEPQVGLHWSAP